MKQIDPDACVELLLALNKKDSEARNDALIQVTADHPQLNQNLREDATHLFFEEGREAVIKWFEETFEN
jgi:UTP:GlnB (protein PII) uridylyltransferase